METEMENIWPRPGLGEMVFKLKMLWFLKTKALKISLILP
jgi:hypothetical protein